MSEAAAAAPAATEPVQSDAEIPAEAANEPMEGAQTGTPESTTAETPAEKQLRKLKVKIDGAEQEVDEDEVVRNYQLRKHLDRKLDETSRARKQFEEAVKAIRNDPTKIFELAGVDPDEFAVARLSKRMELEQLTPEQRELLQLKSEKEQWEAEKKAREEAEKTAEQTAKAERLSQDFEKRIIATLEADQLPKDPETAAEVARLMAEHLKRYDELPDPADAAKLVAQAQTRRITVALGSLKGQALLSALGDNLRREIRAAEMESVKKRPAANDPRQAANEPMKSRKEKPLSEREFADKLRAWGQGS